MPIVKRQGGLHLDRFTKRFLAVWFFPGLLFYATFHVGDPDHTLAIVPVTCVVGAVTLAELTRRASRAKRTLLISTCVLLNAVLFFKPISVTTKPSNYTPVRWANNYIADVIEGVGTLRNRGPVTVVFDEATTGWRQLSYYDPDVHIVLLMKRNGGLMTRNITGKHVIERPSVDRAVTLPSCGTLAWVDPVVRPVAASGLAVQNDALPCVLRTRRTAPNLRISWRSLCIRR